MTRGFSTRDDAAEFKNKMDAEIAGKASPSALSDITNAEKYDILAACDPAFTQRGPRRAFITRAIEWASISM
jgi:hypothetical protein